MTLEEEFLASHLPKHHPPSAMLIDSQTGTATWLWLCGKSQVVPGKQRLFNKLRSKFELLAARLFGKVPGTKLPTSLPTTCRTCQVLGADDVISLVEALSDMNTETFIDLLCSFAQRLYVDLREPPSEVVVRPVGIGLMAVPARVQNLLYVGRIQDKLVASPINPALIASTPDEAWDVLRNYFEGGKK